MRLLHIKDIPSLDTGRIALAGHEVRAGASTSHQSLTQSRAKTVQPSLCSKPVVATIELSSSTGAPDTPASCPVPRARGRGRDRRGGAAAPKSSPPRRRSPSGSSSRRRSASMALTSSLARRGERTLASSAGCTGHTADLQGSPSEKCVAAHYAAERNGDGDANPPALAGGVDG